MKRLISLGLLVFGTACTVFGADFGFTFHQNIDLGGDAQGTYTSYAGGLAPWVSASLNEHTDIYLSGSFAIKYENETFYAVPEVTRFMVSWRPLPSVAVEGGRIRFNDANRILAAGLFDGLAVSYEVGSTRLSLGALYTGLLYKDTADIFMTAGDAAAYIQKLDYNAFGDTYFASRRFLAAAGWEVPSLGGGSHSLSLQGLVQFDLNGRAEKIHTQHLSLRLMLSPDPVFDLTLGGIAGLAETQGFAGSSGTEINFALLALAAWAPPSSARDRVTLGFRWGSGRLSTAVGPFRQITAVGQGNVLDTGLAGLVVINGAYLIQPVDGLSLTLDGRYFLRNDTKTYTHPYLRSGGAQALGAELYTGITWVPVLDISLTAGAGAFFPGMGNALSSNAPVEWKTTAALLLSF
jgi:hypothetical protein